MKTTHIKSNQVKIDFYNRMVKICSGLCGGRNSSPQNSGEIMASIRLSQPIFRSNGNCVKNGSFADSRQIRGEENILILLSKISEEELTYFDFMKITKVKEAYFGGKKIENWEWVRFSDKSEVLNLIDENKRMLNL